MRATRRSCWTPHETARRSSAARVAVPSGLPGRRPEPEPLTAFQGIVAIALTGQAAHGLQHPRHVPKVSDHDRGVALGERMIEPGAVVATVWPGRVLADPAATGLRRDHAARMRPGKNVHRDMLDAVHVAADGGAADLAREDRVAGVVQRARDRVETLDLPSADGRSPSQPGRGGPLSGTSGVRNLGRSLGRRSGRSSRFGP